MRPLAGLAGIVDAYDLFLIDQFGVLHDGTRPYPGAIEALTRLRAAGKRVLLVSNSGKRAADNLDRLTRLGFPPPLYDTLITSGEVAWRMFQQGMLPSGAPVPRRVLMVAKDGDTSILQGLPMEAVASASDADAVIISGSDAPSASLADYEALLTPAAAAGLPAFCLNVDKMMLSPSGLVFSSGRIAELYEALGGKVTWIGKPFPEIYAYALALAPTPAARVIGIGDSIEHDIAGAKRAGFAALLVTGGIHAGDTPHALEVESRRCDAMADYTMPLLGW